MYLFDSSIFLNQMKVDIVSLIFKMGDTEDVSNHCPISDFHVFQKPSKV